MIFTLALLAEIQTPAAYTPLAPYTIVSKPDADARPLWPGDAPGDRPGTIGPEGETCLTKMVPIKDCKDRMVTNVTSPTITPYLVSGADAAMVIAPGGGYNGLAVDREGADIAAWLNSVGVSAFVLKYRVPGRVWLPFGGAPLMDAQRAMGLVRAMAGGDVPSLNKSKVGFMGFSAGSHLTGHLSVEWAARTYDRIDKADDEPCRPDFAIMVSSARFNLSPAHLLIRRLTARISLQVYPWESVSQTPVNAGPDQASALNVTADTPPTMLVQAEDDPVHAENALYYWLALKQKAAAPSELHIYPRGGHGYGRCTICCATGDEVCSWPDRGQRFLQTLGVAPKK
jgi:acetyl esterase/lipase